MRRTENAVSGRDEEFREFMQNRASLLHQSAYLLCGDWHLAHDLVQDTLVKAYQHWPLNSVVTGRGMRTSVETFRVFRVSRVTLADVKAGKF